MYGEGDIERFNDGRWPAGAATLAGAGVLGIATLVDSYYPALDIPVDLAVYLAATAAVVDVGMSVAGRVLRQLDESTADFEDESGQTINERTEQEEL